MNFLPHRFVYFAGRSRGIASSRASASRSSSSSSSSSSGGIQFGGTLSKAIQQQQSQPSPWNISSVPQSAVRGISSGGSSSVINFNPTPTPAPPPPKPPTIEEQIAALKPVSTPVASSMKSTTGSANVSAQKSLFDLSAANSMARSTATSTPTTSLSFDTSSFGSTPSRPRDDDQRRKALENRLNQARLVNNTELASRLQTQLNQLGEPKQSNGIIGTATSVTRSFNKDTGEWSGARKEEGTPQQYADMGKSAPTFSQPVEPAPPAPAPVDPAVEQQNLMMELQKQITQAMQPSAEELELQRQLDAEMGGLELGKMDLEDRPVAMGLITGQQASLEKRGLLRLLPLQRRLEAFQNNRLAQLQALEKQYGFAEGALTRQMNQKQYQEQFDYKKMTDERDYKMEKDRIQREAQSAIAAAEASGRKIQRSEIVTDNDGNATVVMIDQNGNIMTQGLGAIAAAKKASGGGSGGGGSYSGGSAVPGSLTPTEQAMLDWINSDQFDPSEVFAMDTGEKRVYDKVINYRNQTAQQQQLAMIDAIVNDAQTMSLQELRRKYPADPDTDEPSLLEQLIAEGVIDPRKDPVTPTLLEQLMNPSLFQGKTTNV